MKIFISYSSQDRSLADSLVADLRDLGHTVWFDIALATGDNWWDAVFENIRECDVFLFALTRHALESSSCRTQLEYATALGKPRLPVMLADTASNKLPDSLRALQVLDYRRRDKQQALDLIKALRLLPDAAQQLSDPLPPSPKPPAAFRVVSDQISELSPETDLNGQIRLVNRLGELLANKETADDAQKVLEALRKRDDILFARVDQKIADLLKPAPPVKQTTARSTKRAAELPRAVAKN